MYWSVAQLNPALVSLLEALVRQAQGPLGCKTCWLTSSIHSFFSPDSISEAVQELEGTFTQWRPSEHIVYSGYTRDVRTKWDVRIAAGARCCSFDLFVTAVMFRANLQKPPTNRTPIKSKGRGKKHTLKWQNTPSQLMILFRSNLSDSNVHLSLPSDFCRSTEEALQHTINDNLVFLTFSSIIDVTTREQHHNT